MEEPDLAAYDIERYLNIRKTSTPSIGPEGQLAFMMDTTGIDQVWCLDGPQAWPEQLTFRNDGVGYLSFSPTRNELIFDADAGGNEQWQLFRLTDDGSEVVDLTRDPNSIHYLGSWSHDGERFAFTANRRDETNFDGYVQRRDETGSDADLIFDGQDKDTIFAGGWSPNDERLLFHELHSNRDHDLHVLELASGETRCLTADHGEVRYGAVEWGPDGDVLYVTTDRFADTLELAELDVETGDLNLVYDGDGWNVSAVYLDSDSRTLAVVRNVEGYSDLSLFELDDEREWEPLSTPALPNGVVEGFSFGPNAEEIAVAISAPTENANIYRFERGGTEADRWTNASTAAIPKQSFRSPELIHFESFDGLEIPAFFTIPDGDGPFPVIVDIHGGPEAQRRPSFHAVRQYFLANGYAIFEPNVRGSSGYGREYMNLDNAGKRMDSVADVKAGVEWLTDRSEIDADRVVAYGRSYGGYMVLAALTEYPDLWAAGVDTVGIANLVTFLENTAEWRRSHREAEYGSLDDRELLRELSPINSIENIRAPLLVLHGANDPRVPVEEAEQIVKKASEHVPAEKLVFKDEGHRFSKLENRVRAYQTVIEFLGTHI
jgi:dipeptidyl aminopeptidase/acylaminoacyl peptidase